jgi:hypothetical protein
MRVAVVVAALVGATSVSCGSASRPALTPSPKAAATTRPAAASPLPALTTTEARSAYVEIVAASNLDLRELNVLTSSTGAWPLARIRRWAAATRNDIHREAVALRTTRWPLAAAAVATKMADADSAIIPPLTNLAADTVQASADQDWNEVATGSAPAARFGEQMRELLGLPSAS